MAETKILRRKYVEARTGYSRSSIYLKVQNGTFPKPVKLGARAVGWLESEIEEWIQTCIEKRDSRPSSLM